MGAWRFGAAGAKAIMVDAGMALPGRQAELRGVPSRHEVLDAPLRGPWELADGGRAEVLYIAMGCFWGAERIMWKLPGVVSTAVGYMGGYTPNPTYEEVCSGRTGHAEAVLVAYDPSATTAGHVLQAFWENHDPTQGMRQGNDLGTQYRSAIYWTTPQQEVAARTTAETMARELRVAGVTSVITTELRPAGVGPEERLADPGPGAGPVDGQAGAFFYAEDYHQQYLHKNPGGYCNHGPNGFTCQVPAL
ncbi:MAG: peptide-methionine (S)-S-oxide reductase MsrA [Dermatophilaceae bacterium]